MALLVHPLIAELARKSGKTDAQVVIPWHLNHVFSAIPERLHPERIAENFGVFDFALTPRGRSLSIDVLDTRVRAGSDPITIDD